MTNDGSGQTPVREERRFVRLAPTPSDPVKAMR